MTTKTTEKTAKTAKENVEQATNKVADGAREFVKRTAETAQERAEGIYESSKTYNGQLETTLQRAATGYTNMLGGIFDAAFANVNHTLNAVEKLAQAKNPSEAMQIQADYVREHSAQNMEHIRSAYDYVRDVAGENATALREGYGKMWQSTGKKVA